MNILDIVFGDKGQVAIAGAAGGLVRWMTLRTNWREGLIAVVTGAICSIYLGPLAQPIIKALTGSFMTEGNGTFAGFLIGLGGVGVAGFVMDVWKARQQKGASNDDASS